nr:hypothetical protein CFP56_32440 [Quercus suber]
MPEEVGEGGIEPIPRLSTYSCETRYLQVPRGILLLPLVDIATYVTNIPVQTHRPSYEQTAVTGSRMTSSSEGASLASFTERTLYQHASSNLPFGQASWLVVTRRKCRRYGITYLRMSCSKPDREHCTVLYCSYCTPFSPLPTSQPLPLPLVTHLDIRGRASPNHRQYRGPGTTRSHSFARLRHSPGTGHSTTVGGWGRRIPRCSGQLTDAG